MSENEMVDRLNKLQGMITVKEREIEQGEAAIRSQEYLLDGLKEAKSKLEREYTELKAERMARI